ncbi:hypothetical protein I3760_03G119100 [Carya illinoinensis]|nr:hypothetical protein I3760_03G119100 [Carya illinoinensis]
MKNHNPSHSLCYHYRLRSSSSSTLFPIVSLPLCYEFEVSSLLCNVLLKEESDLTRGGVVVNMMERIGILI